MPGAANAVAVNHILADKNDNHTFLFTMDDLIFGQVLQGTFAYNQFQVLTIIGTVPFMLVGNPSKSIPVFKTQVKYHQNVSISNNGATGSAAFWMSKVWTNLQINNIPYKGLAPELTDVMAGQVDYGVASVTGWHPYIQAGKIVPIMVSSNTRVSAYPDVPTYKEYGFVGQSAETWFGVFARQDTDTEAVKTFTNTVRDIVKTNTKIQNLRETGMNIVNYNTDTSTKFISREISRFNK